MSGEFSMTILGRTIEHLGTQMYKHRAPSIAELVANCWDAGANNVWITLPEESDYDQVDSEVVIMDDGEGMDGSTVENRYLVVGLNRREIDGYERAGRKVMGRKGIGKLAGFGLAARVVITTWRKDTAQPIEFSMSLSQLKATAGQAHDIKFPWIHINKPAGWPESGTRVQLDHLRHASPLSIESLTETLSRRFSRTTRGEMNIFINGIPLAEPFVPTMFSFPADESFHTETLPSGQTVKYRYRFATSPIRSKELQGFVIYSHERTAQAPPFFFNVESTASSQHSTRYVTGEIIADFLDDTVNSEDDLISTDRQELDWEKDELKELLAWGDTLSRKVLRDCAELKGQALENWVLQEPSFEERLAILDPSSRKEISGFLKVLGQKSDKDEDRTKDLADSLIRAYEFRMFHDVIDDLNEAAADPADLEDVLGKLYDWKVLESRAILEIVKGRLSIINKLQSMIITDAPETASSRTSDNLHDLLAEYPWVFNPEWQVFVEEKSISKILRQWGEKECPEDIANKRIDFLAFSKDTAELVIIELKRPGHAVTFEEVQRLGRYQVALMKTHPNCRQVLVYGGTVNIPSSKWESMKESGDFTAMEWSEMFARARSFYSHYQAILEGDVTDPKFKEKALEVARTRLVIESGTSHRSAEDRARGVGSSEI